MQKKAILALVLVLLATNLVTAIGKPTAANGVQALIQNNQTYVFSFQGNDFAEAQVLNKLTPNGPDGKPYISDCESDTQCSFYLRLKVYNGNFPQPNAAAFKGKLLKAFRNAGAQFDSVTIKNTDWQLKNYVYIHFENRTAFNYTTQSIETHTIELDDVIIVNESYTTYTPFKLSDLQLGKDYVLKFTFVRPQWKAQALEDLSFNLFGLDLDWLAWFNTAFNNKQQATQSISTGASVCGSGVVLPINFSTTSLITAGKLSSDCNATRPVNDSENFAFINYIENTTCNTGNTAVWANFTCVLNGNNSAYIYYNNNATTTQVQSDPYAGDAAVKFWNDFSDGNKTQPVNNFRTDSNLSCAASNPGYVSGIYGNAVNFSSASFQCTQGLALSNYITGNNTFTIEMVVRRNANFQLGAGSIYCAGGYDFGGGNIAVLCSGGATNSTWLNNNIYDGSTRDIYVQFSDTNWHHYVFKSYGTTTPYTEEIWMDGVLVGSKTHNGLQSTASPFRFFGGLTGSQTVSVDSFFWSNDNKSTEWIKARAQALVANNWVFGTEQVLSSTITFVSPSPANNTWLNQSYAYVNVTITPAVAGDLCYFNVANETGQFGFNMTSVFSGGTLNCFYNQTNAIGTQNYNVTHQGGSNTTSGNQNYILPRYEVKGFDLATGSALSINVSASNTSTSFFQSVSSATQWFHNELTSPISLTASAAGYSNLTQSVTYPGVFTIYPMYLVSTTNNLLMRIHVVNNFQSGIQGATVQVNATFGSSTVTVASGTTDGSGTFSFYATPGNTYSITATFGTASSTVSLNAAGVAGSAIDFTITLNTAGATACCNSSSSNVSYQWTPQSGYLFNSTTVSFNLSTFGVTNLTSVGLNVTYTNGTLLLSNASNTSGVYSFFYNISLYPSTLYFIGFWLQSGASIEQVNRSYFGNSTIFTNNTAQAYNPLVNITAQADPLFLGIIALLISTLFAGWVNSYSRNAGYFVFASILGLFTFVGWFPWLPYIAGAIAGLSILYIQRSG